MGRAGVVEINGMQFTANRNIPKYGPRLALNQMYQRPLKMRVCVTVLIKLLMRTVPELGGLGYAVDRA